MTQSEKAKVRRKLKPAPTTDPNLPQKKIKNLTFFPVPEFDDVDIAFGASGDYYFNRMDLPKVPREFDDMVNLKLLLASGYKPNNFAQWTCEGKPVFHHAMFEFCGKEPDLNHTWDKDWLIIKPKPEAIPAKDEPVMVRDSETNSWARRYSAGMVDRSGHLICYNDGLTSWSADEEDCTSWKFYRSPTEEELNDNKD